MTARESQTIPAPATTFPLKVSPNHRRLLDATGRPFLMQGDAAWSLIANTTIDGATRYLDERRALGFNTIMVSVIEYLFSADPPRNVAGDEPFLVPGDFTKPNPAYMDHVERVLGLIADRGFLVLLAPAYLGYPNPHYPGFGKRAEGWYDEVVANGTEGNRRWGEYLGRRFGRFDNVMWMMGGDRNPGPALEPLNALAHGLRSTGITTPFTAHVHPEDSPIEAFPGADWLDVNPTYTYGIVHRKLIDDWNRDPAWPFFLIESTYEGEHDASELQIRRQAYWSVLCGGNGHIMGNKPMWMFGQGWEAELRSPGSVAMAHWGAFLRALPWFNLEPDERNAFATRGLGEARGLDRVTAAVSTSADLAVAYLPIRRPLTVNPGPLTGAHLHVDWFEPATGRRADGGDVTSRESLVLEPPFAEDSVLTITSRA
jgi:uncharacterized protein DUF4038/collagenase-like protein with putative collagen-binding domain